MSATDNSGITDGIAVTVNDEPWTDHDPTAFDQSDAPDVKGPDPAHWASPEDRQEPEFDEGDPDTTRHDDIVRDETGAMVSANTVTHVKGPGPEWPQDDASAVEG